jgi:Glyoxalase-like domain
MPAHLDHIVVVAHSLAAGAEFVERSLGLRPGPGRKHQNMGTHNLLLSLGASVYLEVVAVDPEAASMSRPRWFGLDHLATEPAARLAAWVANTDDIQAHASTELGVVEKMEREGLTWKMSTTSDGNPPLSGAAPLLIQRATNFHPASRLPDLGLRLRRLRIRHPYPDQIAQVLARIELADAPNVTLEQGTDCALCAEIETPFGVRALGEA